MALVYLYVATGRHLALEYDEPNDEVTAVVWSNLTDNPWSISYDWKNQTGQTVTVPAQDEGSIGIPPGQRKFVRLTPVDGPRKGFDSEIGSWYA